MTENEKKLLQAKHRLEEAEMRDRQKERKARTRRLVQEGAILEKALPQTTQMTLEQLEDFLCEVFKPIRLFLLATGYLSLFLFPEGRTYSPPAKQAVVSLPLVGLVRSSRTVFQTVLQRGQAMSQANIPCAVGSIFALSAKR